MAYDRTWYVMGCVAVPYHRRVKIGCMRDRNRARSVAEAPGTPTKERAMYEAPTEKSRPGFPADSHSERDTEGSPSIYTCAFPAPVYLHSAWLEGIKA